MSVLESMNLNARRAIFLIVAALCLMPFIDPPIALLLGFLIAQTIGNPFQQYNSKATQVLLKSSVVGLGFSMNINEALKAGQEGLVFTVISISVTLLSGFLIGKWLKVEGKTSFLISSGTAICGGSAIAAVSPIVRADAKNMSVALGTIFILNSVALLIFPTLGHLLNMSQHQFGLWSAIAIHDTSSVVGAATKFGQEALKTATTVKLERALWIIPLSLITMFVAKGDSKSIKIPYFIGFYIIAMCICTYLPEYKSIYETLTFAAKRGLTLTLFLIGSGLSLKTLRSVGIKPLIQGVLLWVIIGGMALAGVLLFERL